MPPQTKPPRSRPPEPRPSEPRPPGSRASKKRVPSKIAIVAAAVVAVGAALVIADRSVAGVAEHRLASRLTCVAGLTSAPKVTVGGFPFVTQAMTKTFRDVDVSAPSVTFRNSTLTSVHATAHDLRLPESGAAEVSSLSVEAVVPYTALATKLASGTGTTSGSSSLAGALGNATFGSDGDGRLTIGTTLTLAGRSVPTLVYADLSLDGSKLTVTPEEVELTALGLRVPASRLPSAVAGAREIELPVLPDGMTYRKVGATGDGLDVVVAGSGLQGHLGSTDKSKNCGGNAG